MRLTIAATESRRLCGRTRRNMKRKTYALSRVILCLLGVLFFSLSMLAQKITGDMAGYVADPVGAAMSGATITVTNPTTNFTRTVTTNAGNYWIPDLPIGIYTVKASKDGFAAATQKVGVGSNMVVKADFQMQVGRASETITVEGAFPLIDLSNSDNNSIDNARIENMPLNGQDFNSLLALTPGVQRAPGGGFQAVSINGMRTSSNNYLIDGLYNNDRYYGDSVVNETGVIGIPATLFPMEALQEVSVQGTPSAEFGVKGGAPINLIMKSGTNSWHGSMDVFRHTSFADAADYFSQHMAGGCPTSNCTTPLRNMLYSATLGGSIVPNKLFFFTYYEGQRFASFSTSNAFIPTQGQVNEALSEISAAGMASTAVGQNLLSYYPISSSLATAGPAVVAASFPTTANMENGGVKVDFQATKNHMIAARYIVGDSVQMVPPTTVDPVAPAKPYAADMFDSVVPTRAQLVGLSWNWNINNNKVLESRLGMTRLAQTIGINNSTNPTSLGVNTGSLDPLDYGVPYLYLQGFSDLGGVVGFPTATSPTVTFDWSEHFSWVKGNHIFRFGGNYQKASTNSVRDRARTELDFDVDPLVQLLTAKADFAARSFGSTRRHLYQQSAGFYFQDAWKVTPRLTLNYGLRYDLSGAIGEKNNLASNFIPGRGLVQVGHGIDALYNKDPYDIGPRFGFAYDLHGDGKSILSGGYAMSYDMYSFASFAAPYTFAGARTGAFTNPDLGDFAVSLNGNASVSALDPSAACFDPANMSAGGDYICFNNQPVFGNNPTGSAPYDAFAINRDLRVPRVNSYNLALQSELFRNTVLTVSYVGSSASNLVFAYDQNASPLGCNLTAAGCSRPNDNAFQDAAGDPYFGHIITAASLGHSRYDSLQASFRQRSWHGIDTAYNLTWSKCFDENSVNRGGSGEDPQLNNPLNVRDNRGLCDYDVQLNFNLGGTYNVPTFLHFHQAGEGWQLGVINTSLSGRPGSVTMSGPDTSGQGLRGSSIRASWDGTPIRYNTRNPDNYIVEKYTVAGQSDPCGTNYDSSTGSYDAGAPLSPFYTPCVGQVGNSRRNQIIGPGLSQWDLSLTKATRVTEHINLQIRWEVYNALNRANFSSILSGDTTLDESTFGVITSTPDVDAGNPVVAQGGPRNMVFVAKVTF